MTEVMEHTETDVRERILVTAERLYREIGYQKTTVADIAKSLHMSPANVYRFFDSKKSITAGVARRLMGEVEHASQAIATGRGSAKERLRALVETVHRMNSDRYVGDAKLHEMVAVAMEENWEGLPIAHGMCRRHVCSCDRGRCRVRRISCARRRCCRTLHLYGDDPFLSSAIDRRICR